MATIRLYTTPTCSYCRDAKAWLDERSCEYDALDITSDVRILREWRALTGGEGVPALAHGNDLVIGFSPERYEQLLECCEHTSHVDAARLEKELGEAPEG